MKQQILIIHGGDAFETYGEYMDSLRETEVSLEWMKQKNWKATLQETLGDTYEVFAPRFPNAQNARYAEWKIIFEKYLVLLDDDVILIGHSLGGIFLAKYATEGLFTKPIKATFLLAAPYSTKGHEPIVDFTMEKSFTEAGITGERVFIYHSKDDAVVPYEDAKLYQEALPEAKLRTFADKGHFNQEAFPELVEELRSST